MSVEKAKTIAEVAQIALNVVTTLIDRGEKKKADAKKIADLEAEVARLKAERSE